MIPLPITGGSYQSDSLPISNQRCINWRVNIPQTQGALTDGNLFGTEGLFQIETSGTSQNINRGSHDKATLPYYLNGEAIYRLDRTVTDGVESFVLEELGTIPGIARASMASNGTELIVITGGRGWIIDESSGTPFLEIVAAGFTANGVPQQVIFIDSYFLVTTDSKKFIRSDENDGLTWVATNVFTAESDPDDIVTLIKHKNQAFIAGSETIEEFRNLAGIFQRSGFFIDKGVFAPFGMVKSSKSFMWIGGGEGETPAIWELSGNEAQKVSTTAIDSALDDLTTEEVSAAFTYKYGKKGAYIIGFTFPSFTFEYNEVTQIWNERESQITDARGAVSTTRFRVNSMTKAYNKIICGDAIDGRIGVLDDGTFTEYGDEIIRTLAIAPLSNQGDSFSIPKLVATMEGGVGDAVNDPQLRLSVSKDAKKFNNELSRGFGKVGEFLRQAIWRGLGRFTQMSVLNFVMSDDVKPVFIKLEANIKAGR
ncbi:hypothetical protein KAR91_46320 [Candidatus Pacearchaeota archaeon]|nr:hypothetical protein [Candidatus Pacearchaeota archaeon]